MIREEATERRGFRTESLSCDLVVVGGGMAGSCCALTAARAGLQVTLIQDRPVLGGNASSEVRLWILGATAQRGNNNRWAREGGVIDELLVENHQRNPEGNAVIFDSVLLDKVAAEPRIRLLLNTAAIEAGKEDARTISWVRAFCSQNQTMYEARAPLFCDASGDGVLGFLAGAAFRMGAEAREEFGEGFAPSRAYGELLGHSIYFYTKDAGHPVRFIPPRFALSDIRRIPRYKRFNAGTQGCQLWWIEYGGRLDTIHQTEAIKWELWRVVYGVWDHIKNSGQFPEAETKTLEWVGLIPGKRESRRFEGDYILRQTDLVERRAFPDAVSFGGWSIDLHPADGVYSERPGCDQWHAAGVYEVPYRCLYSRNIGNLFLAGRIISASHVAFGSTRVMATCAHAAQAVGMAAVLCRRLEIRPRELTRPDSMGRLQRALLRRGQYIPGCPLEDPLDEARRARIEVSSEWTLGTLEADGPAEALDGDQAQLLPLPAGAVPGVTLRLDAVRATTLQAELRTARRAGEYTPDVLLDKCTLNLAAGENQPVRLAFDAVLEEPRYVFFCLRANEALRVRCSAWRVTGLMRVRRSRRQQPPEEIGIEAFDVWRSYPLPGGHNWALSIRPPVRPFRGGHVTNGFERPTCGSNAWVAAPDDPAPALTLRWNEPLTLGRVVLVFDTDFDDPLLSVLVHHPERAAAACIRRYRILDGKGVVRHECAENYQTRNEVNFDPPLHTSTLRIELPETNGRAPAALFAVRAYAPGVDETA